MSVLCCPCFTFCMLNNSEEDDVEHNDCGSLTCTLSDFASCMLGSITKPFRRTTHYQKTTGLDVDIAQSEIPGLEPGSWVQFLMNHQRVWWGFADLRWEWRLASTIPADVYGASLETTIADLQLVAALAGMHYVEDTHLLAATSCGEHISFSQHNALGLVAYYRSTRENIRTGVTINPPNTSSEWLHYCIEACRNGQPDRFSVTTHYSTTNPDIPPTVENLDMVLSQLARQRTKFDAQLPYSCGNAMWIFNTKYFRDIQQNLQGVGSTSWSSLTIGVLWGPLGKGINSCSCSRCCDEWEVAAKEKKAIEAYTYREDADFYKPDLHRWPALALGNVWSHKGLDTLVAGCEPPWRGILEDLLPPLEGTQVSIECTPLCHKQCAPTACHCGKVARLADFETGEKDDSAVLGVVAVNTEWLRDIDPASMLEAAQALLSISRTQPYSATAEHIAIVIAYTEYLLLRVRKRIGSTNIWNAALSPTLTNFSPLVFGS
ncbi:hypothetical protein BDV95DRAFT_601144 [Massariosphaeria phaeospora]|uniref:Uncharacterized protein n=1 Tax=Massariosphaeria phaeospora TaxID=100035 RepID=A0A7C8MLP1_9PLEO|nr:hypothetical protein BDV95DRAFT_601144 [Massariosphaeria phaeospora]